jgi:catechol 2,3-dioxygenase-like lactoylglutathione lyase family enzyme
VYHLKLLSILQIAICQTSFKPKRVSIIPVKVYRISAITLLVKNMEKSCKFYSKIPGFRLVCGGASDLFTTYEVGQDSKVYLNLELNHDSKSRDFGRIIFHTSKVDKLYLQLKNDQHILKLVFFENEPKDAPWGERFFHMRDPDGYQLSFAMPLKTRKT